VEDIIVYGRGATRDPCGRPVIGAAQSTVTDTSQTIIAGAAQSTVTDTAQLIDECASLVNIIASDECAFAMSRAALRVRQNVRCTDTVLLLERTCAIGLPATTLQGAQAVARRVSALLVDINFELQVFYGHAALLLWQRLQSQHARVISAEEPVVERPHAYQGPERESNPAQSMPYLAYLEEYPPRRLFHLFPYELACRYRCVPVGAERDMLTIGTNQRLDESVIAHMQEVTRRGIFQVRCEISVIDNVLRYWQNAQEIQTA